MIIAIDYHMTMDFIDIIPAKKKVKRSAESMQRRNWEDKGGHGFAAEDANTLKRFSGKKAEVVGTSNEKNGR